MNDTTQKTPALAWILLFALAFIWGASFFLIDKGLDHFSALQVAAIRVGVSFIVTIPFIYSGLKKVNKRDLKILLLPALFGNAIPAFLFAYAQTQMDHSLAGVLNSLSPLWALVLGIFIFKQKEPPWKFVGVFIGLLGAVFVIFNPGAISGQGNNWFGLFIVLATAMYGFSANVMKSWLANLSPMTITSLVFGFLGPWAWAYLLFFSDFTTVVGSEEGAWLSFGAVSILAVFGTVLGTVLFVRLLQLTNAVFGSMVAYLIPLVALGWGVIDGEKISFVHFIGLALILLGVFLTSRSGKKKSEGDL